jgi:hypothetical protein
VQQIGLIHTPHHILPTQNPSSAPCFRRYSQLVALTRLVTLLGPRDLNGGLLTSRVRSQSQRRSTWASRGPFLCVGRVLRVLIHTAHHICARSMVTFNAQLFHFGDGLDRTHYGRSGQSLVDFLSILLCPVVDVLPLIPVLLFLVVVLWPDGSSWPSKRYSALLEREHLSLGPPSD